MLRRTDLNRSKTLDHKPAIIRYGREHPDEKKESVLALLDDAIAWFHVHGVAIQPPEDAKRAVWPDTPTDHVACRVLAKRRHGRAIYADFRSNRPASIG